MSSQKCIETQYIMISKEVEIELYGLHRDGFGVLDRIMYRANLFLGCASEVAIRLRLHYLGKEEPKPSRASRIISKRSL